jgi:hypothetical protein
MNSKALPKIHLHGGPGMLLVLAWINLTRHSCHANQVRAGISTSARNNILITNIALTMFSD